MISKFNAAFLALIVVVSLITTGCPRVRVSGSGTVTVSCPAGQRCTRTVSGTITITPRFNEFSQNQNHIGIFDLPNQWIAVDTPVSEVTVKISDGNGQFVEQTFALTRMSSNTITPVDKDTTPIVFVYNDPAAVNNFFNSNTAMLGFTESEVDLRFNISVMRADCQTSSGKYPGHIRYQDGSGITYVQNLSFDYTAAENVQSGCDEGELQIEF